MTIFDPGVLDRLYERASEAAGDALLNGDPTARPLLAIDPEQVMELIEEVEALRGEVKFHLESIAALLPGDDA